jgi:hypothetical protein
MRQHVEKWHCRIQIGLITGLREGAQYHFEEPPIVGPRPQ